MMRRVMLGLSRVHATSFEAEVQRDITVTGIIRGPSHTSVPPETMVHVHGPSPLGEDFISSVRYEDTKIQSYEGIFGDAEVAIELQKGQTMVIDLPSPADALVAYAVYDDEMVSVPSGAIETAPGETARFLILSPLAGLLHRFDVWAEDLKTEKTLRPADLVVDQVRIGVEDQLLGEIPFIAMRGSHFVQWPFMRPNMPIEIAVRPIRKDVSLRAFARTWMRKVPQQACIRPVLAHEISGAGTLESLRRQVDDLAARIVALQTRRAALSIAAKNVISEIALKEVDAQLEEANGELLRARKSLDALAS